MPNPQEFYQKNLNVYQAKHAEIKKKLGVSSTLRLLVFLAIIAVFYFLWSYTQVMIAVAVVLAVFFGFLVKRHTNLQYKRDFLQQLLSLNETEIKVLHRDFYDLPSGEKFKDDTHFYSMDVDLFGRGSFFQYLNRTSLESGAKKLSELLKANDITRIEEKQEAIQELSAKAKWRQEFNATAALAKSEMSAEEINSWLKSYTFFVPKIMKVVPLIFSVLSIAVVVLAYFAIVPELVVVLWLFLGLGIAGVYIKKVMVLADKTEKAASTFQQYYKLILMLEEEHFESSLLKEELTKIKSGENEKASLKIKKFSKILDSLNQRNNMLMGIFINGFFLNDLRQSYNFERWIEAHAADVEAWFDVIHFFDAYNSLGNFSFNHPSYAFAEVKQNGAILDAKNLAHPLLDPAKAVTNDFAIAEENFFIITGANMAGKSTFLRTVSLSIVMSNMGLPIFGNEVKYNPIKLITSMRTSDSLTDDESYFFSELKRLQTIVNAIDTDRYFIILDEILKGTNSEDKAKGSKKFVEKLVASNSTGIIATHDLSLCEIEQELEPVSNYYFDAQIIDGELYFDYTFKPGICQNMNASFLLQKMGII